MWYRFRHRFVWQSPLQVKYWQIFEFEGVEQFVLAMSSSTFSGQRSLEMPSFSKRSFFENFSLIVSKLNVLRPNISRAHVAYILKVFLFARKHRSFVPGGPAESSGLVQASNYFFFFAA